MMSIAGQISHVLVAATTLPTAAATVTPTLTQSADSPWMLALVIAWAVVGLVAAWALGAFGQRGIVGPERLGTGDSAWTLLGVLCGGMLALIVATSLLDGLVRLGVRSAHAHPPADVQQLAVGGLGEGVAAAVVLLLAWQTVAPDHLGLARLGLALWRVPVALVGGATALFILFPLVLLSGDGVAAAYRLLHRQPIQPHQLLRMMDKDHGVAFTLMAVLTAVVVAPVAEELAFRGLLQTMLARVFDLAAPPSAAESTRPAARWAAVLLTSAAFAAVHDTAFIVPIFVLSVGLGFAYERSANLWMTIVAHGLFNGAQIALFLATGG